MTSKLNARFFRNIFGFSAGTTQTSQAAAGTSTVTGSSIAIPRRPGPPRTYRITMAGTKTGANAAFKVHVKLGGTQILSLTSDDGSAVDWMAIIVVMFKDATNQRVSGQLLLDTADPEVDYAAGTVDCTAGATMLCQIESQHESDTVTCEMVTIEGGE